jgi:hypothetical protein
MTPVEMLKAELKKLEAQRAVADQEDRYARLAHHKAQAKFSAIVDNIKAINKAIESLESATTGGARG